MCLRRVEAPGAVEPFLAKGAQARTCWSCWIGARPRGIFEFFIDSASQLLEARELVLAQVEHLAVGSVRRRVTPAFSHLLPVRALIVFNELSFHALEFFLVVHVGSLLDMVDGLLDGADERIEAVSLRFECRKVSIQRTRAVRFGAAECIRYLGDSHANVTQK